MRGNGHLNTDSANLRQYTTSSQGSFVQFTRAYTSGFQPIDLKRVHLCDFVKDAELVWCARTSRVPPVSPRNAVDIPTAETSITPFQ